MEDDLHATENQLQRLLPALHRVPVRMQRGSIWTTQGPRWCALLGHDHRDRLQSGRLRRLRMVLLFVLSWGLSAALPAQTPPKPSERTKASAKPARPPRVDRSGKVRKGKASYYGRNFYSKKMADGTAMNPQSDVAASKTLPLGTKARVTNLQNGSNAVVEIRDRGPYVKGRIVDVSPKTADKLGLKENGTAPVEVKPLEVPQSDGSVKSETGPAKTAQ
jgi:rare lipoprotein A